MNDIDAIFSNIEEEEKRNVGASAENTIRPEILRPKEGHKYFLKIVAPSADKLNEGYRLKRYYWINNFNSRKVTDKDGNGKYINLGTSPRSLDESKECPVVKMQQELWDQGESDLAKVLYPRRRLLLNVLVLDNDENPEWNGSIKVLDVTAKESYKDRNGIERDGSPVCFAFDKAVAEKDGSIFDLSKEGSTLVIKIKKNGRGGDWSAEFLPVDEGGKSTGWAKNSKNIENVRSKAFNLQEFIPEPFDADKVIQLLNTHLLCKEDTSSPSSLFSDDDDDDFIPGLEPEPELSIDKDDDDDGILNLSDDEEEEDILAQFTGSD